MRSPGPPLLRHTPQFPGCPNPVRLGLPWVIGAFVLVYALNATAEQGSHSTRHLVAIAGPGELGRLWDEAVGLERESWDLERSEADRSYRLALGATRRFEAISEWFDVAGASDADPYRHVYWRTARSHWLAADVLELADRDRRREHLNRAIEFSDRGLAANADCAACMLWKFNAMGRLQQIDGLFSGARNVKVMAQLLERGIALEPDFHEGERSSTIGNLHYVSAIFYRVLPDWFWLRWIIGVRGDKERALAHARTAVELHKSRIDYRVEVGSQLLCLGAMNKDPQRLAEGRSTLAEASMMRAHNLDDQNEIAAAHLMIATPMKACSYAGAEWIEIEEDGAIASMR